MLVPIEVADNHTKTYLQPGLLNFLHLVIESNK